MEIPDNVIDFVRTRSNLRGSIMHIGGNNAQVVLVADDGEWLRFVVPSMQAAHKACELLKVEAAEGYPDDLRMKMASYRRTPEDWAAAPYPERLRGSST